jgi:hypothetical protein
MDSGSEKEDEEGYMTVGIQKATSRRQEKERRAKHSKKGHALELLKMGETYSVNDPLLV